MSRRNRGPSYSLSVEGHAKLVDGYYCIRKRSESDGEVIIIYFVVLDTPYEKDGAYGKSAFLSVVNAKISAIHREFIEDEDSYVQMIEIHGKVSELHEAPDDDEHRLVPVDPFEHLRQKYFNVAPRMGMLVRRSDDHKAEGVIVGTWRHNPEDLKVKFSNPDGSTSSAKIHPYTVDYLVDGEWQLGSELRERYDAAWGAYNQTEPKNE